MLSVESLLERVRAAASPCVRLNHSPVQGFSKIGGLPNVPPGFEWPRWQGRPLQFLCQIDLAAIRACTQIAGLPAAGALLFFYDEEQSTWGFDPADRGSWRVVYAPEVAKLVPHPCSSATTLPEIYLKAEPADSLPYPERLGLQQPDLPDGWWDSFEALRQRDCPLHQIGGFPIAIQNDGMEVECQLASNGIYLGGPEGYASDEAEALRSGAADWTLVLQLDSDDAAEVMWGDSGTLYFWVKRDEGEAGNFADAWMVLQCC